MFCVVLIGRARIDIQTNMARFQSFFQVYVQDNLFYLLYSTFSFMLEQASGHLPFVPYCSILEEVVLDSERLEKITPVIIFISSMITKAQRDLFLLLSRVMFFYNSDDSIESFFKHFPDFPNAFLVGSEADIFVIELADQD